ncbi:MAG: MATE family efflux transporter [Cyanobacteria bacterium P01_E01_bin.42]
MVSISVYLVNGISFATETLTGVFKGENARDRFIPLLQVSFGISLLAGLLIGGICTLFPDTIFGLLSNHRETIAAIRADVSWLIAIVGCLAAVKILYGYFGGLTRGEPIRNASLWGGLVGFTPLAICAWHTQSNQILWLALLGFLATRTIAIAAFLPGTLQNSD